jgi:hypothetical protein
MRDYNYREVNKLCSYELQLKNKTNVSLLNNFFKCADWIEENCPKLNGEFKCEHNPYYWIKLVVENGKAYLECGSHGWRFDFALSQTETAIFSRGSMQDLPYAFEGKHFFRNDRLEEFLSQWKTIKSQIVSANNIQTAIYDENFEA